MKKTFKTVLEELHFSKKTILHLQQQLVDHLPDWVHVKGTHEGIELHGDFETIYLKYSGINSRTYVDDPNGTPALVISTAYGNRRAVPVPQEVYDSGDLETLEYIKKGMGPLEEILYLLNNNLRIARLMKYLASEGFTQIGGDRHKDTETHIKYSKPHGDKIIDVGFSTGTDPQGYVQLRPKDDDGFGGSLKSERMNFDPYTVLRLKHALEVLLDEEHHEKVLNKKMHHL